MNKFVKYIVAALALVVSSIAQAKVENLKFTFKSFTDAVEASGTLGVNPLTGEVVSISGSVENTILGKQTIGGIVLNTNYPSTSYSPDGLFYYDNILYKDHALDIGGILFTTVSNTGYWNLWGSGLGKYTLYASANGGYPVQEFGTFTVTTVPELSTWILMLTGMVFLYYLGNKRKVTV
jgi:hypothetical protein